jgi:hypothetical protein
MYHNVMSRTIARRLGACVNNTIKIHHALRMSTTAIGQQKLASEHYNEHLDRLPLLQSEDLRRLKPVKAKIQDYHVVLDRGLDLLTTLPAALEPLTKLKDTAYTSVERAIVITEAQAQLRKLKDASLPNLLAHVEDLELEPFPEPGSSEDEIDFLQRLRGMNEAERKDLLDTLNMEMRAAISQVTESVQNLEMKGQSTRVFGSDAELAAPIERKENPFAKVAANVAASTDTGKKKTEEKTKFGMSTDDQFASVIAKSAPPKEDFIKKKVVSKSFGVGQDSGEITTWKPDIPEKPKTTEPRVFSHRADEDEAPRPNAFSHRAAGDDAPRPKAPLRSLNFLQAQLEKTLKRSHVDNGPPSQSSSKTPRTSAGR